MEKVESVTEIAARPEEVYHVITNSSYILKMFRDAVAVKADPPGRAVIGQKFHVVGVAGRRKIDIYLEVVELVPNQKTVSVQRPGGVFKSFRQTTVLEPRAGKTQVRMTFDYELSLGYIGKLLNAILVEKLIRENLAMYASAVKEIAELVPLPEPAGTAPI